MAANTDRIFMAEQIKVRYAYLSLFFIGSNYCKEMNEWQHTGDRERKTTTTDRQTVTKVPGCCAMDRRTPRTATYRNCFVFQQKHSDINVFTVHRVRSGGSFQSTLCTVQLSALQPHIKTLGENTGGQKTDFFFLFFYYASSLFHSIHRSPTNFQQS